METWRNPLTEALKEQGESWSDIEAVAICDGGLDKEFDAGWGSSAGEMFTAWTPRRVYFPAVYDGSEWVASVPRHPNGEVTAHVGGQ